MLQLETERRTHLLSILKTAVAALPEPNKTIICGKVLGLGPLVYKHDIVEHFKLQKTTKIDEFRELLDESLEQIRCALVRAGFGEYKDIEALLGCPEQEV